MTFHAKRRFSSKAAHKCRRIEMLQAENPRFGKDSEWLTVFLYAAVYDEIADTEADYEAVFDLHAAIRDLRLRGDPIGGRQGPGHDDREANPTRRLDCCRGRSPQRAPLGERDRASARLAPFGAQYAVFAQQDQRAAARRMDAPTGCAGLTE